MPLVIDGNNLLHSLPPNLRSREEVRRRVLEAVRHETLRVTVVFDGPPRGGSPAIEHLGRLTIHYSGPSTADDVILRMLPQGSSASSWTVVTDDRDLRFRVRQAGGRVRSLAEWRHRRSRSPRRPAHEPKMSSHELAEWERFFAAAEEDGSDR
jgi:hypothetical protein